MKKNLIFAFFLATVISCGNSNSTPNNNRDWDNEDRFDQKAYNQNPQPENSAINNYQACLNHGYPPSQCSDNTGVRMHTDSSGSTFLEYMGEYMLMSAIINGRPYNYFNSYGYYPSLGFGYPQPTVVNRYITNYNSLPSKNVYLKDRSKSAESRYKQAQQLRKLRNDNKRMAEENKKMKDKEERRKELVQKSREKKIEQRRNSDDSSKRNTSTAPKTTPSPSPSPKPRSSSSSSSSSKRR